jgi:Tfp pilus assembly protein PilF
MGHVYCRQGNHRKAHNKFQHPHCLEPELAIALVCMADAYHCLGELDRADEHYHKAVEVNPDYGGAPANLKRWRK